MNASNTPQDEPARLHAVPLDELTDVDEKTNSMLERLEDEHCPFTAADFDVLRPVLVEVHDYAETLRELLQLENVAQLPGEL